jgi:predicted Rossmann fold nucleotide-binding protein DprA/Smf involved in DNA uptake
VVVSGGARGADETAHLAASRRGPGTIIVLPTGILNASLRADFSKRLEEGKTLLLSEFPPEFGWTVGSGMQRNRLLAALSWVLTMVEPGLKGGTGGTGRVALKIGVPLFILQNGAALGEGAAGFLNEGATLLDPAQSPRQLALTLLHRHRRAEIARQKDQTPSLFPP